MQIHLLYNYVVWHTPFWFITHSLKLSTWAKAAGRNMNQGHTHKEYTARSADPICLWLRICCSLN